MLEHIFRNINDIRVFDTMTEFPEEDIEEDPETIDMNVADIDDIMNMLEYNEYKRIEVEDAVKHLVDNEILGIRNIKVEGKTGCRTCKWTDKLKLPRIGEHNKHKPEEVSLGESENYYMKDNDLTRLLRSAVFQHVTMLAEKEERLEKHQKEEKKDNDKRN